MIQRDYILRMIEEIGRFLAKVSGLKDKKMVDEGYEAFLNFLSANFKISENEISLENLDHLEEKLEISFKNYPDDLGQLFSEGAEMAHEINKGSKAEVLFFLGWKALKEAENNSQTFRFERQVEMNNIKEKLALMGINVE